MYHDPDQAVREFLAARLRALLDRDGRSVFTVVETELRLTPDDPKAKHPFAFVQPGGPTPMQPETLGPGQALEETKDRYGRGTMLFDLGEVEVPIMLLVVCPHPPIRNQVLHALSFGLRSSDDEDRPGWFETDEEGWSEYYDQQIEITPESFERDVVFDEAAKGRFDLVVRLTATTRDVLLADYDGAAQFPRLGFSIDESLEIPR